MNERGEWVIEPRFGDCHDFFAIY
ncbi:MAG: hypothetical protein LBS85_04985 [Clostridiales Family XIII bacterium]|nr:hypothetical protein [Clostridiales Family XIII bacterium]